MYVCIYIYYRYVIALIRTHNQEGRSEEIPPASDGCGYSEFEPVHTSS